MARRNNKEVNELVELISRIPWWVSLLCAAVAYFALHAYATSPIPAVTQPGKPADVMSGAVLRGLANVGQYVIPILFCAGAFIGVMRRKIGANLIGKAASTPGAEGLNQMSWSQFELLVGETLRRMGYDVVQNGGGGADGGVDLLARKDGKRYIVQCKQWRTYRVGVSVVREHYGVITAEGAAGGLVVTSGRFTQEAVTFAAGKNITLVDGDQLRKSIGAISQSGKPQPGRVFSSNPPPSSSAPSSSSPVPAAPSCPVCNGAMVMREAKQGSKAGSSFWGCRQFPKCRGIRAA